MHKGLRIVCQRSWQASPSAIFFTHLVHKVRDNAVKVDTIIEATVGEVDKVPTVDQTT
jgi:hypothetical protein